MRYPVEYEGQVLLLAPELAGTIYHLRAAMAGEPVELTPSNQAQAYRMRKAGIPIRFSTRCSGYYIGDKV